MVWALAIGGLIVLGMLELGLHAHAVLRTVPPDNIRRGGPITGYLQKRAGFDRVLAEQQLLGDREAVEAGLYKVHGYEPVPLTRYTMTMRALNGLRQPDSLILGFEALDLRDLHQPVLDLLGVRYAVVRPTTAVDWESLEPGSAWPRVRSSGVAWANTGATRLLDPGESDRPAACLCGG